MDKPGGNTCRRPTPLAVGVVLSVLLHAIALWLVIERSHPPLKPPESGQERIIVSLMPEATEAPVRSGPQSASRPNATVKKAAPKPKQSRKPVIAKNTAPEPAPKTAPVAPPQEAAHREMSVQDDMFTQLEAKRRRRTEERAAQAGSPPSVDADSQRDSVALANIAESLKGVSGARRNDAGGVFQIRHVGVGNAEFMFYGWSTSSRRNSMRLVTVDRGAEVDIETAVVKKMIEIIREEKKDTFVWESHRLGRELTLSAKPEDSAELQRFLIREFFPDYIPSASTGANRSGRG